MSLLEVTPSTIVARLATGNLKAATPAEILTLLGISTIVQGPASSTDNALVRFDLATGKLLQNSSVILTDAGALSGITSLAMGGALTGVTTLNMSGALTVGGLVDGRDLAVDGAKLDGIEAGATADQTAAEIKTAYESNANTNAFTDAEQSKLTGIEAGADVTDVTNVTAAGALMDSEVDADIKTLILPANTTISAFGASLIDDAAAINARATLGLVIGTDIQAHSAVLDATTASFLVADETKLDGIEALADVTDEANVTLALDGATLTGVIVASGDKVLIQDISDTDNLKTVTAQSIADLAAGGGTSQNLIINGNFNIWQRGTSFAAAINIYTGDRFRWVKSGVGVVTITKDTDVPDEYSESSFKVDTTTVSGTPAAGDFYFAAYKVEGFDAIPLAFGSADAKTITISFLVKGTKTGIHSLALRNSAVNRSYVAEYTINVSNTWEEKSVTIAGDTTGTWLRNNGVGLEVDFTLASGSTFKTTPGTWQAGNFIASTNQVNALDNVANDFKLSRIKLEIGSVATDFVDRYIGQELTLAQRYYRSSYNASDSPGAVTEAGSHQIRTGSAFFAETMTLDGPMRSAPTVVIYSTTGASGNVRDVTGGVDRAATITGVGESSFSLNPSVAVTSGNFHRWHWTADAEL